MAHRDFGSTHPCLVVGVGASAGGLDAFQRFLAHMPLHPAIALVYVQHLDPRHESVLAELLARHASLPVQTVHDETPVEPGNVYVIPPNTTLAIEDGVLRLGVRLPPPDVARPIDAFLRSLAADQGERAVGIILSGTGNDGTAGLQAIKDHGGTTLAQLPASAAYDSMPQSAIAAGLVDYVLTPEEMPARLIEEASQQEPALANGAMEGLSVTADAVCETLRRRTGHDFAGYKRTTLVRRISRRMDDLKIASPFEYLERLEQDSAEAARLFKEMLIGVTAFFRDPYAFDALAQRVVPRLFEGKGSGDRVRVWVSGCATGEEVYSLAMLLSEQVALTPGAPGVQIFATDIDEESLQVGRRGAYPQSIREGISPERLARFFTSHDGGYHVIPELRQLCIFSRHNVLHDPPFPDLDLVSCRNLLIYLESRVQGTVIGLFHHALRPGGFLFLGSAENIAGRPDLFDPVDRKQRIYQRLGVSARSAVDVPLARQTGGRPGDSSAPAAPIAQGSAFWRSLERAILDEYVPPGMVVREGGEVLYLFGATGKYLGPSAGAPSANAFNLIHKSLRIELRRALQQAAGGHDPAVVECGLGIEPGGERTRLLVRPFSEVEQGLYLVIFQDVVGSAATGASGVPATPADEAVERLQDELRNTRQQLLATIDQLETANQELQSSNEELLSLNEELQSANEELQSSKEEVQSINGQLEAVNRELTRKVEELGVATSDLESLFEGAQMATIFLDNDLLVKRFTPTATEVFRLRPGDVGRPVTDITARFTNGDVATEIREVLRTLQRQEVTVTRADDGNRYLMRILPYRTRQNVIDGVVVTFLDVTELKRVQEALERANADLERSAASLLVAGQRKDDFLAMLAHELRNPLAVIASNLALWRAREVTDPVLVRGRELAERQVLHMTRLLNDLLDTARIIRGTIELRRAPLDLRDVLRDVVDAANDRAAELHQTIILSLPPEPIAVDGDADRLQQVVGNLVNNAQKYTPAGGHIRVSAEAVEQEALVRVSDDGLGLTPDLVPRVFDAFVQGRRSSVRAQGGLGLGLTLVRHLAEQHGGRVEVRSAGEGLGSEFTVRLPLGPDLVEAPSPSDADAMPAPPDSPKRVLVVDDNPDVAELLATVLRMDGHEATVAHNGRAALQMAVQSQPQVVLLDIGLPDMDGHEVARRLRLEPGLAGVALVAITGYGQEQDRQQSKDAGFDHHMVKPVDMDAIRRVLRDIGSAPQRCS